MISVYQIKPKFQQLLKPILLGMRKLGISPNQITIAATVLSLGLGICLWNVNEFRIALIIVPLGLLLRMALNALDGMMATSYQLQSKKGEMLNELGDVISDLFIYIPMIQISNTTPLFVLLFVSMAILNEFAGLLAKVISGERRYDGPMGKSDRALTIGILLLILFYFPEVATYIDIVLVVCSSMMMLSSYTRIKHSLSTL
jgi:CDP-diacylglycerol--glycerol-3-phosphate 3-phosphatidyltransferase